MQTKKRRSPRPPGRFTGKMGQQCPILMAKNVPQTDPDTLLHTMLTAGASHLARYHRPWWAYQSVLDFVLTHGTVFRPAPLPEGVTPGVRGKCFGNALLAAIQYHLDYVEGYGLTAAGDDPPYAFLHAWCTDASGVAYEVTSPTPWFAYFGMRFSVERADDATWRGNACVLNDHYRGYPLLTHRWQGEPVDAVWPESPWLTFMREGKQAEAWAWCQAHMEDDDVTRSVTG